MTKSAIIRITKFTPVAFKNLLLLKHTTKLLQHKTSLCACLFSPSFESTERGGLSVAKILQIPLYSAYQRLQTGSRLGVLVAR